MPYLLPADLYPLPGALEIAQVATPENLDVVPAELMQATLTGADRTQWPPHQVAAADAALARVNAAIADAEQLVDGYLAARYALPLAPVPTIVKAWVRALVRYALNQYRITDEQKDPIARDRRDVLKFLADVSAGKFSLGATDPQVTNPAGDVRHSAPSRVFDQDTLADY